MSTPEATTWTVHPAAEHPWRMVLAIIFIILALFAVEAMGGGIPGMVIAAVVLLGAIAEFLLPTTYRLDADGAHRRFLGSQRMIPWARVRRVYLQPNAIILSPLPTRSWLESYRGMVLRTSDPATVLQVIRQRLSEAGEASEIIEES